jgi:ATP-dependent Clp protease ATP-binding subunit ClpB
VLLLDEVEKAHPDVFGVLLQLLDDGRLTDGKGRTVDFTQTLVLMTSNLQGMDEVRQFFRPEFINRLDDVIPFEPLDRDAITRIVRIQLDLLKHQVALNGLQLEWDEGTVEFLAEAGYDPVYGARPLKRALQKNVSDLLARQMIAGGFGPGDRVRIERGDDGLTAQRLPDETSNVS